MKFTMSLKICYYSYTMSEKVLVSGIKPTGRPHVGNYFAVMKQNVELCNEHEAYVLIADYHALTSPHTLENLSENIVDLAIDYLAIGLDPEKAILFKQSDVPAHTELAWIFNCLTTMPYLMRAHAFKDAEAKSKEINAGLFTYPLLMAADILLYGTDIVPAGHDQRQHVEIARDTAEKFNNTFGETFKLPKEYIVEAVKTVPGTDGQKMSKSYNNTIPLFATPEEIAKAVMSIPTDSAEVDDPKDPSKDHIFALHELFSTHELDVIREGYEKGGLSYKESKDKLIANIEAFIAPLREKRAEIAKDRDAVLKYLKESGAKARAKADAKMDEVRKAIGVKLY